MFKREFTFKILWLQKVSVFFVCVFEEIGNEQLQVTYLSEKPILSVHLIRKEAVTSKIN